MSPESRGLSYAVEGAASAVVQPAVDPTARRFVLLLLAATLVPFIVFLALERVVDLPSLGKHTLELFGFFVIAHVPLTSFFWVDRRYRSYMHEHRTAFYALPAAVIGGCVAIPLLFGDRGANYLYLGYFVWLLWHYSRQNWGLLCLTAIGTKTDAPSALERLICQAAPVAGILGALGSQRQITKEIAASWLAYAWGVGAALMAALLVVWLFVFVRQLRAGVSAGRIAMTALSSLFFVPSFVSGYGFLVYATAHGAQYFTMMYTIGADRKQGRIAVRLGVLTLIAVVGYVVMKAFNDGSLWRRGVAVTAALGLGITISHFLVDARLWRLKQPFQRRAIQESFAFLFR